MVILGIDPGTAITGFGVIKCSRELECLGYGSIQTNPSLPAPARLKILHQELAKLIKKHKPNVLAVENIYFFKNTKTAMPVSQAKGVILLAAAEKNIPVREFTPLQVKMGVTGHGKAEKKQVQRMVQYLLRLEEIPKLDDAADALAVAVCCQKTLARRPLTGVYEKL